MKFVVTGLPLILTGRPLSIRVAISVAAKSKSYRSIPILQSLSFMLPLHRSAIITGERIRGKQATAS